MPIVLDLRSTALRSVVRASGLHRRAEHAGVLARFESRRRTPFRLSIYPQKNLSFRSPSRAEEPAVCRQLGTVKESRFLTAGSLSEGEWKTELMSSTRARAPFD